MKTPEELVKNDLFYMHFGFDLCKFRVNYVTDTHVFAHKLKWDRKGSIPFSFEDIKKRNFVYYKKMSKFRAFFLI